MSPNRLEGSLCDTSLDNLLEACRKSLVTGTIDIEAYSGDASIELRAGAVDRASFGALDGEAAVNALRDLHDGLYELRQRLPEFDGSLGRAAQFVSPEGGVGLIPLMRYCEDNALSCTITVVDNFDRGQVRYRAGEIVEVSLNGTVDDDAIVALTRMDRAKFQVTAPPLDLDVLGGWPSARREPTAPFVVEDRTGTDAGEQDAPDDNERAATAAERPLARGTDAERLVIRATTSRPSPSPRARALTAGAAQQPPTGLPWMIAGAGITLLAISLVYVLTVLALGHTP